ncbi:MAG: DNA primase [Deltaproteobacteria bacterium CG_4_10_14_0_2_um_filter_43_8]|nr:MAG: DNA primase [Deltaproteobacteria bacterium CG11_big_fil_rev_8_21_14_0_20_42_23]PJA19921.1 MAG: DNA primase [Deltaproteobacteria bacterium CG_4_10_14_0_2_um_filter_43_8]PJC64893.1 MAG: DNA primase [Deltaproteobacteria bacterium CG_4_9_14_0_2_um_filter_42_21]
MSIFSKSFIQDLRERTSIVAFVGDRLALKKAGRNFRGVCPFHNEKTPSFMVNDEKGIFHCFGCGEGGDVIRFLMLFESLSFPEAIEHLAQTQGVELPAQDDVPNKREEDEKSKRKKWALRLNEIARDFFISELASEKGEQTRSYLEKRGFKAAFFKQHFLGFADKSWDGLALHLKEKKAPLELAVELGLLRKRDDGGYYNFFRNRLIFPILSQRGEVLGFGGRALDDDEPAKYLNSPDSQLYHKSNTLYGLNAAKGAIRRQDQVVLVEGYTDVLSLMQAGIEHVVAPLGTALTEGHVKLLKRYTRNIVLVFDGDKAGSNAQVRALELFLAEELIPKAVALPQGEDPDSLVQKEGKEGFLHRIQQSNTLFEFFIDDLVKQYGIDSAGKIAVLNSVLPLLKSIGDPIEQTLYRQHLSRRLLLEERTIREALKSNAPLQVRKEAQGQKQKALPKVSQAEQMIVTALLQAPQYIEEVRKQLAPSACYDAWSQMVLNLLFSDWEKNKDHFSIAEWIENIEDEELARQVRSKALEEFDEEINMRDVISDCLENMKRKPLQEEVSRVNLEIRKAELEGNDERLFSLLGEKQKLTLKLRQQADE